MAYVVASRKCMVSPAFADESDACALLVAYVATCARKPLNVCRARDGEFRQERLSLRALRVVARPAHTFANVLQGDAADAVLDSWSCAALR